VFKLTNLPRAERQRGKQHIGKAVSRDKMPKLLHRKACEVR
jgi:hypothetical protein